MNKYLKLAYKYCFVPKCKSTTIETPSKIFFYVPQNAEMRKKWFNNARHAYKPSESLFYCCEDHFDLKEDVENYTRHQLMGQPARLRKGVVPHKFYCHQLPISTPRKRMVSNTSDDNVTSQKKQNVIADNTCEGLKIGLTKKQTKGVQGVKNQYQTKPVMCNPTSRPQKGVEEKVNTEVTQTLMPLVDIKKEIYYEEDEELGASACLPILNYTYEIKSEIKEECCEIDIEDEVIQSQQSPFKQD